jgi:hypothetical protein
LRPRIEKPARESRKVTDEHVAPNTRGRRTCGMRFSVIDASAIALCGALVLLLWRLSPVLALAPAIVLVHFFLFCNVFRVRRQPELIWSAAFIINAAGWAFAGRFSWVSVMLVQVPLTIVLLIFEVRHPRYHGICSRRLNARHIDDYLTGRIP